jgi:hypothetical protein
VLFRSQATADPASHLGCIRHGYPLASRQMRKLVVVFWIACAVFACGKKAASKTDCDKFADMEVKCAGAETEADKAKIEELREIYKSVCEVKPDPTPADLSDTTSPAAKELAASRVELAAKKACAVKTGDCAEYKKCLTASGIK